MNPYDLPAVTQARRKLYELVSRGDGPLADFAKEVVAGRRAPRDALKENWVLEGELGRLTTEIDRFRALPEEERTIPYDEAMALVERRFEQLGSTEEERAPQRRPEPDDDDEERGPFLSEAW